MIDTIARIIAIILYTIISGCGIAIHLSMNNVATDQICVVIIYLVFSVIFTVTILLLKTERKNYLDS